MITFNYKDWRKKNILEQNINSELLEKWIWNKINSPVKILFKSLTNGVVEVFNVFITDKLCLQITYTYAILGSIMKKRQ